MARSRNIKPQFFTDAELIECEPWVRLLFAGLWTLADREGRLIDKPKQIKINLFPSDAVDVDAGLQQLHDHGLVIRYAVSEGRFVQVKNFLKHQNPHYKEELSQIPAPEGWVDSSVVATGPSAELRAHVLRRDGKCRACGATEDLTLDHIIPRSKGGTDDEENLQALCRSCNSGKNNRQAAADHRPSSANHPPSSANHPPVNRADSLIPDSLSLDSSSLIPDSLIPDCLGGASAPEAPAAPKAKRAIQVPETWMPNEGDRAWAEREGFTNADQQRETPRFIRHHRSKGNVFKDISAAWKNWMVRSREFAPNGKHDDARAFAAWDVVLRALEHKREHGALPAERPDDDALHKAVAALGGWGALSGDRFDRAHFCQAYREFRQGGHHG